MILWKISRRIKSFFGRIKIQFVLVRARIFFPGKIKVEKLTVGKGFSLDINAKDFLLDVANLSLRDFCSIRVRQNGKLKIGTGVFFNSFSSINCMEEVTIGNNTICGEGVKIYDHNHRFRDKDVLIDKQGFSKGAITIGSNCWLGSNVIILKGVTIGNNVVIGANCIIFKDIPPNSIVKSQAELSITSY